MTVLEAKSAGTIIIANRTPNLEYLITHREDGILYKGNLNQGVKEFMGLTEQEKEQMMVAARADYQKRFCKEQAVDRLMDVYNSVAERSFR